MIDTIHVDIAAGARAAEICQDHATVLVDIKTSSFQSAKRFYRTLLTPVLLVHVQARVSLGIKILVIKFQDKPDQRGRSSWSGNFYQNRKLQHLSQRLHLTTGAWKVLPNVPLRSTRSTRLGSKWSQRWTSRVATQDCGRTILIPTVKIFINCFIDRYKKAWYLRTFEELSLPFLSTWGSIYKGRLNLMNRIHFILSQYSACKSIWIAAQCAIIASINGERIPMITRKDLLIIYNEFP